VSDTTDLMGARVEETAAAPATDASAPATGAGSRRRRGTGLEGMVLAELQQVASGLGIRGTARMRKSQLIEVIKEAQAGGGAAPAKADAAAETKPKRRATSKMLVDVPLPMLIAEYTACSDSSAKRKARATSRTHTKSRRC